MFHQLKRKLLSTTMPLKIMTLRNVPEDELHEIRDLLTRNGISFYETPAGNWGISSPAIWLENENQQQLAQQIIADYQKQRQIAAKHDYQRLKEQGEHKTLKDSFSENPLRFVFYVLVILGLIYISTKPFVTFID